MLTYQLQNRVLMITGGKRELVFPNDLTVKVEYGPPEAFGVSDEPSRLVVLGSNTRFTYNANAGHTQTQSTLPLAPLDVRVEADNLLFELKGATLHLQSICQDATELENILRTYLHGFPALLNIEFPDPPVVLLIEGTLGETEFRWEHQQAGFPFRPRTQDGLEQHVFDSLNNIQFLQGRLLAAIQYFHTASRLIVAGHSSWEFMAESVLNM